MECMCAQTGPQLILSSEGVLVEMESETMLTPREKFLLPEKSSSEEDRTQDATSRTASPTHYQPSYTGPESGTDSSLRKTGWAGGGGGGGGVRIALSTLSKATFSAV